MGTLVAQLRQMDDGVFYQVEPVNLVLHPHVEGGGDGAFLLVSVNGQVAVETLIGQFMDQGRIAVEGENNRFILGKDGVVFGVA